MKFFNSKQSWKNWVWNVQCWSHKGFRRSMVLAVLTIFLVLLGSHFIHAFASIGVESDGAAKDTIDSVAEAALEPFVEPSSFDSPLTLGKAYYDAGQYSQAQVQWEKAVSLSVTVQQQAIAQNYLAIACQSLGQWDAADALIRQAQTTLNTDQSINHDFLYAQVLSTLGTNQLQTGQPEAALDTWRQAESLYKGMPTSVDTVTPLLRNQLNQVQALRQLGYYRRTRQTLEQITQDLAALPTSTLKVNALQSLGITLRQSGDLNESKRVLLAALAQARSLQLPTDAISLSYAKTLATLDQRDQAIGLLASISPTQPRLQIEVTLFELSLWQQKDSSAADTKDVIAEILSLQDQIQVQLPSRWSVYAAVNLSAIALDSQLEPRAIARLLSSAINKAKTIDDYRAESFAIGQLGHLYEQVGQVTDALTATQQALSLSQQSGATDLTVKWKWQQGRLLIAQDELGQARAAYADAVDGLALLKQDLVAMNPDVQFSFREQVEPVYRQFIDLLLRDVDKLPAEQQQRDLTQARDVAESLQLAELENYFREACLTYQTRSIETIDLHAAVIYSIVLPDRLEIIFSAPDQILRHASVSFDQAEQQLFVQDVNWRLHPLSPATDILPLAQTLYSWLVRPFQAALDQQSIQTLVFVSDGFLRSFPMSILHDGDQYLIENYQVALTPGLQLLNSQPLDTDQLSALTSGISESRDRFGALPGVRDELTQIQGLVTSQTLLNTDFTKENFFDQAKKGDMDIIHLATHGQFSSLAQNTFLLAWDSRINVRELDQLFHYPGDTRQPIELLVLSACQTASGDDRSALGIAGTAVRSGARTTVATLWSVADSSTAELITELYRQLIKPGTSRAEALRQAQLSLLKSTDYSHPYYWSPFVLVGNWQ